MRKEIGTAISKIFKKKTSLKTLLVTIVGSAIVIPSLFSIFWFSSSLYDIQLANALRQEQQANEYTRDKISSELARNITILKNKSDAISYFMEKEITNEVKLNIGSLLSRIMNREKTISEVLVLDSKGDPISVSEKNFNFAGDQFFTHDELVGIGHHFIEAEIESYAGFIIPLSGRTHIASPRVHEGTLSFDLSVPIGSPVLGVLISRISIHDFWADSNIHAKISQQSTDYILDNRGSLLTDIPESDFTVGSLMTEFEIIRQAIVGEAWDSTKKYTGVNDTEVFGTHTLVPKLNWTLVSEVPVSKIMLPIRRLLIEIIVFIGTVIFLFALASTRLAQKILEPVSQIMLGIAKVSDGKIDHKIPDFDISEFDRIGKNFNIMVEARNTSEKKTVHQSKLASIGELAAGLGHEINNPLTVCVGNIKILRKHLSTKETKDPVITKRIGNLEKAHENIRKIEDGLRVYSRIDTDKIEITSINFAIEQTVNLISEVYKKDGITLEDIQPDGYFYARADVGKLQQVILNLITNAKDATESQTTRIITLNLRKSGDKHISFSITDNGTGIPDEIIDKILDPFFTTKEVGKGTGMGLGLVTEIIKKMGGRLTIDSKVGKGSVFSVILPASDEQEYEKQEAEKGENKLHSNRKLEGLALVVDDEANVREIIVSCLSEMGLKVEEADDGDTALIKVTQTKYDYIFTDMKMARVQGDEFIRNAKKLPNGDTKYFVITGGVEVNDSSELSMNEFIKADGYIMKPFTEESIYEALKKAG